MIDTLAILARDANPEEVYSLNTARALAYGDQIGPGIDPQQQARATFLRGEELLNSGKTESAIKQFQTLLRAISGNEPQLSTHNKRIFERIGLSFLRLGEQKNCMINHTAESCVMPFRGGGIHTWTEGSRIAIQIFSEILETFPNDLNSRYLLNIAHMTLGTWPEGVPEVLRLPETVLGEGRDDFPEFEDVGMATGTAINGLSGGVVIADVDGDELLDIMASSYGFGDPLALLVAQKSGGFVNRSSEAGLDGITGGLNLVQADYDNDGDTDVLVLRGGWYGEGGYLPNSLLQNQGDGTFRDVTRSSGILSFFPTQTAVWSDLDTDGWLDLIIGNENEAIECYHNQRDGTFLEMGLDAGLSQQVYVKGLTTGDYDRDGKVDVYVSVLGGSNLLYHNDSQSGQIAFSERAIQSGVSEPRHSFPTWFWDVDQDGWLDIYVSSYDVNELDQLAGELYAEAAGFAVTKDRPRLYRNRGDGTFEDITVRAGLDRLAWAMGSSFGDLDNNGFPDVFLGTGAPDMSALLPNQVYRNLNGISFEEVIRAGRFGHLQKGHGVGFADFDLDGDQDVYLVVGGAYEGDTFVNSLYRNPGTKGHWISLWLEGQSANRSALNTRIEVDVVMPNGSSRTFFQQISPGSSFGGNSLRADIGLGNADSVSEIRVKWQASSHPVDTFPDVNIDRAYRLSEGGKLREVTTPGVSLSGSSHDHTHE